jgi:O-antigen/teichoic acid export membrane protein
MCQDKGMLFKRINKVAFLFILFGWPIALISGYVIFMMYGNKYPFDLPLTLLFTTAGVCISIDMLYGQLLCSVSVIGAKITSYAAVVMAVVSVILNFLLIPIIGLAGAIIASIISYILSICIMIIYWPKLINSH